MQGKQGASFNNNHLIFVRERKGTLGFPGGSSGKEPPAMAGDMREVRSIPGSGRSLGGGNGTPLQYSCLENALGQRSLADYSPWGRKESDTTEATACMNRTQNRNLQSRIASGLQEAWAAGTQRCGVGWGQPDWGEMAPRTPGRAASPSRSPHWRPGPPPRAVDDHRLWMSPESKLCSPWQEVDKAFTARAGCWESQPWCLGHNVMSAVPPWQVLGRGQWPR